MSVVKVQNQLPGKQREQSLRMLERREISPLGVVFTGGFKLSGRRGAPVWTLWSGSVVLA